MPLLEKAYAKLDQNYERIGWGNGMEGLRALTGKPTTYLKNNKASINQLKAIHKAWAAKNYPATASCCNSVAGGIDGLISGHAYTLLDVKEVGGHTLAKVRNPWAKESYKGAWRDSDPNWTASMKAAVNLKVADDGIFWMPYENFVKFF